MRKRTNRRELIVETASQLFLKHGYNATSVRQIADQVGCTEAALYYHFKNGKRELLGAVAEQQLEALVGSLTELSEAESLCDLIAQSARGLVASKRGYTERIRWISAEFAQLDEGERALFHQNHTRIRQRLAQAVEQFVEDPGKSERIAQTLICVLWGYAQLYHNLGLEAVSDFSRKDLAQTLAEAW